MFRLGRAIALLTDALTALACLAAVLMMLHITLDVVMRLAGHPIPATVTIVPHYYMLPIIFLPLAMVERKDAHITVEVVAQLLPRLVQKVLAVLAWVVTAGVFGILFWQTWIDAVQKTAVGTFVMELNWKIPLWASYWFLPVGLGAVILVLIYRVVQTLTGARSGLGEVRHEAFRDRLSGSE